MLHRKTCYCIMPWDAIQLRNMEIYREAGRQLFCIQQPCAEASEVAARGIQEPVGKGGFTVQFIEEKGVGIGIGVGGEIGKEIILLPEEEGGVGELLQLGSCVAEILQIDIAA